MVRRVKEAIPTRLHFWCPGCDDVHGIDTTLWSWNGDLEHPTFDPSVKVVGGPNNSVCHSWIKDGMIAFLKDSTHELAGQTVEIPEWPMGG